MSKPGPKTKISTAQYACASAVIGQLPYRHKFVVAMAVLLEHDTNLSQATIGRLLGLSVAAVKRTVASAPAVDNPNKACTAAHWGGDRRSKIPAAQCLTVLHGIELQAARGEFVTVEGILTALEKAAQVKLTLQTVYNLLSRHGWRKIRPDKLHPKNDPAKVEEFKKKLSGRPYVWLSPALQQTIAPCE